MPLNWWFAIIAAALILAYPADAYYLSELVVAKWQLYWLNRRMERMARRVYRRLQQDHREMGLEPLPPFSWTDLERRYSGDE